MPEEKYILGGRTFLPLAESTLEHDVELFRLLRSAGLREIAMQKGESGEAFGQRLLEELLAGGKALELLGCVLIPEGTKSEDWTPEIGSQTAAHLAKISNSSEKLQIQSLLISLLILFFEHGLCSLGRFMTSLGQPEVTTENTPRTATDTGGT